MTAPFFSLPSLFPVAVLSFGGSRRLIHHTSPNPPFGLVCAPACQNTCAVGTRRFAVVAKESWIPPPPRRPAPAQALQSPLLWPHTLHLYTFMSTAPSQHESRNHGLRRPATALHDSMRHRCI
ncbi:hypothetical protein BKA66DRAFT_178627 [Pyrenochaeta sp. MPI-SDFR-AT-0127]|nr:hypothetical protein BKA66DRAFT_178627 [Pyrenochaeta sp. MPI-SDFR-AT-0127]